MHFQPLVVYVLFFDSIAVVILAAIMSRTSYKLLTVNTAPERAKRLIGIVAEKLKDRYVIEHAGNCEGMSK